MLDKYALLFPCVFQVNVCDRIFLSSLPPLKKFSLNLKISNTITQKVTKWSNHRRSTSTSTSGHQAQFVLEISTKPKEKTLFFNPNPQTIPTILSIGQSSENIGTSSFVLSIPSWYCSSRRRHSYLGTYERATWFQL